MRMLVIGAADVLFVLLALEVLGHGCARCGDPQRRARGRHDRRRDHTFGFVGRSRLAAIAAVGAIAWGRCSRWHDAPRSTGPGDRPDRDRRRRARGHGRRRPDDPAAVVRDEVLARVFGLQEGLAMAASPQARCWSRSSSLLVGVTGPCSSAPPCCPIAVAASWSRLTALDAANRGARSGRSRSCGWRRDLRALPAPPLESVARRAVWRPVPAGTVVIKQGDVGDTLLRARIRQRQGRAGSATSSGSMAGRGMASARSRSSTTCRARRRSRPTRTDRAARHRSRDVPRRGHRPLRPRRRAPRRRSGRCPERRVVDASGRNPDNLTRN